MDVVRMGPPFISAMKIYRPFGRGRFFPILWGIYWAPWLLTAEPSRGILQVPWGFNYLAVFTNGLGEILRVSKDLGGVVFKTIFWKILHTLRK